MTAATPMPAAFIGHGSPMNALDHNRYTEAWAALGASLPRPRALLVVSAHWEAPVPTVMTSAHPPMLYDYYGFPPESYEIEWPAPGAPHLASRVQELLTDAGVANAADPVRGYDHGTFIPLKLTFPECGVACAEELDTLLAAHPNANSVAAFIFEPVVGATLGAAVPPDGYCQSLARICREHDVLLIADEIMCGMGRTGRAFAVDHWNVEPDMITLGKGVAGGYAPLGAVIVGPRVVEAIARGSGAFQHGFTYQNHPVSMAAGNAVLDVLEQENLFARVNEAGGELFAALAPLKEHRYVGDVRGLGLFTGIEFVQDKAAKTPFAPEENIAGKVFRAAMEHGVLTYPTQGCVDGVAGDHILLAPPFIITAEECRTAAQAIAAALDEVAP